MRASTIAVRGSLRGAEFLVSDDPLERKVVCSSEPKSVYDPGLHEMKIINEEVGGSPLRRVKPAMRTSSTPWEVQKAYLASLDEIKELMTPRQPSDTKASEIPPLAALTSRRDHDRMRTASGRMYHRARRASASVSRHDLQSKDRPQTLAYFPSIDLSQSYEDHSGRNILGQKAFGPEACAFSLIWPRPLCLKSKPTGPWQEIMATERRKSRMDAEEEATRLKKAEEEKTTCMQMAATTAADAKANISTVPASEPVGRNISDYKSLEIVPECKAIRDPGMLPMSPLSTKSVEEWKNEEYKDLLNVEAKVFNKELQDVKLSGLASSSGQSSSGQSRRCT